MLVVESSLAETGQGAAPTSRPDHLKQRGVLVLCCQPDVACLVLLTWTRHPVRRHTFPAYSVLWPICAYPPLPTKQQMELVISTRADHLLRGLHLPHLSRPNGSSTDRHPMPDMGSSFVGFSTAALEQSQTGAGTWHKPSSFFVSLNTIDMLDFAVSARDGSTPASISGQTHR